MIHKYSSLIITL